MRNSPNCKIERARVVNAELSQLATTSSDGNNGCFFFTFRGVKLVVIASDGGGWDHVSVRVDGVARCPTWDEMCYIKEQFFKDDEAAIQIHPTKAEYVNDHPFVLHLWRSQNQIQPLPPEFMVGLGNIVARAEASSTSWFMLEVEAPVAAVIHGVAAKLKLSAGDVIDMALLRFFQGIVTTQHEPDLGVGPLMPQNDKIT
jgi:hypothetical protein